VNEQATLAAEHQRFIDDPDEALVLARLEFGPRVPRSPGALVADQRIQARVEDRRDCIC
jgi:hypothetical protein